MTALTTIDFHGSNLIAIPGDRPETTLVAMKPVVEGMGLSWQPQHRKIMSHSVLKKGITMTVIPSDGGEQDGTCLSLDLLNFWLATIHPDRIKNEATRAKVIEYQTECARVLFDHFFGKALARGAQSAPHHLTAQEVGGIVKGIVNKRVSESEKRLEEMSSMLAALNVEIREKLTPTQRELSDHAVAVVQEKVAEKQALVETRVPGQIAAFPIPANLIPKRRPNTGTCRLPVGEIGRRLGIGAAKVNAMLADLGLQSTGTTNQPWMVTDNGEFFGIHHTKRQILWSARTLDVLRWRMEVRPFAKAKERAPA
ncbi:phage antirepressor N-terminal domain-containing protein [Komagataeibacter xylinus]|uniref:phage antirepressor N-terminal domain-containing protein n=1 Tax=Komagataeibacter xylinus TaxID=28448 RepID=UPI00280C2A86|nr:phage antirepressor N-terminal domain-containing protein [Komagataeibacter xylinus]